MAKSKSASQQAPKRTRKAVAATLAAPSHAEISLRAYHIYLERGSTPGDPMQDWLQAERELTTTPKKSSRKSKIVSIAA